VVTAGVAVTVAPVVALNPVAGDHEKLVPATLEEAFNVTPGAPSQIAAGVGTVMKGLAFTVMFTGDTALFLIQPLASVMEVMVTV
jgi:hypothetical protein